jgi:hypothetical protein
VLLGKTMLTATVSGVSNNAVTWSVNGITGVSSSVGTISEDGIYTAPADLPSPATVKIIATSIALPASNGSAQITVTSEFKSMHSRDQQQRARGGLPRSRLASLPESRDRAGHQRRGTKNATAQITVINHDLVSVLPGSVTLAPGAIQFSRLVSSALPAKESCGNCKALAAAHPARAERSPPTELTPLPVLLQPPIRSLS